MRNLSRALNICKDHVSAVLDLDYSPTGQEIVTGSYDKTIKLWRVKTGDLIKNFDVFHQIIIPRYTKKKSHL